MEDIHYTDYEELEKVYIYCKKIWVDKQVDHLKPREEDVIFLKNGFRFTVMRKLITCLDCKNRLIEQGKYI